MGVVLYGMWRLYLLSLDVAMANLECSFVDTTVVDTSVVVGSVVYRALVRCWEGLEIALVVISGTVVFLRHRPPFNSSLITFGPDPAVHLTFVHGIGCLIRGATRSRPHFDAPTVLHTQISAFNTLLGVLFTDTRSSKDSSQSYRLSVQ